MSNSKYQRPRGMHDIFGQDQVLFREVIKVFERICDKAGIGKIATPILEQTELFNRAVGDETEIVSKEMYSFKDRSDNYLTLKPEGTAGVVRSYIENGMASLPKPVELYYVEPHFRYERPQSGRYRQFYQLGIEIFGDPNIEADLHAISLGARLLNKLNIRFYLSVNSIGSLKDRQDYAEALKKYLKGYESMLPVINQEQLKNNPLRILDSKDDKVIKIIENAPHIVDYLNKDSSERFQKLLMVLEGLGIEYELNSRLVRGFDYYNDVVFEFISKNKEIRDSLGGGGRFDGLVESLGGYPTPAVGLSMGVERIIDNMKINQYQLPTENIDVFVVGIGYEGVIRAAVIREKLLDENFSVRANFTKKSITDQLGLASKCKAQFSVIIGEKEAKTKQVIVKDMQSANQQTVPVAKLTEYLRSNLVRS